MFADRFRSARSFRFEPGTRINDLVSLNRSLLSPLLLFPLLWIAAALLSQVRLLDVQEAWSPLMFGVVACVPLAFVAGGLIGSGLGALVRLDFRVPFGRPSERTIRLLLLAFMVIGLAEMAHQFAKIGGIPLITPGGNVFRFEQGGPSIILINFLTVAGLVSLVRPPNIFAREYRLELLIAVVAMGAFALQNSRGAVALMIVVALAARWLYWGRPKWWLLVAGAIVAVAVLTLGFYLRTRVSPSEAFEAELFGEVLPGTPYLLRPFVPLYLAITTNFHALSGLIEAFPATNAYGGGAYNAIGLDIVFPGAKDISTVSAEITPPWITSTIAGSLWADGGFPVLIGGVALTGIISVGVFTLAMRTRSLGWCLVAGYLLYVTLFGLYTNLWTQHVDWLMVSPLLLVVGWMCDPRKAEAGPGKTHR